MKAREAAAGKRERAGRSRDDSGPREARATGAVAREGMQESLRRWSFRHPSCSPRATGTSAQAARGRASITSEEAQPPACNADVNTAMRQLMNSDTNMTTSAFSLPRESNACPMRTSTNAAPKPAENQSATTAQRGRDAKQAANDPRPASGVSAYGRMRPVSPPANPLPPLRKTRYHAPSATADPKNAAPFAKNRASPGPSSAELQYNRNIHAQYRAEDSIIRSTCGFTMVLMLFPVSTRPWQLFPNPAPRRHHRSMLASSRCKMGACGKPASAARGPPMRSSPFFRCFPT